MELDKRYQVFVSSTYTDLQEERRAVIATLLEFGAIPAGMELFPAADEAAWDLIKRVIDECDYYLLLIGGRYGSVDADGLSYTEKEFDYAASIAKPIMAFTHENPEEIPAGKSEKKEALQKRLTEFRSKVEQNKHVKHWKSAEDLAGKLALTLPKFVRLYPATGWIRSDSAASPDAIVELNQLRKENFDLQDQLRKAENRPPPGAEDLSQGDASIDVATVSDIRVSVPQDMQDDVPSEILGVIWSFTDSIEMTWNEILEAIGPRLLDECNEEVLYQVFETHVGESAPDEIRGDFMRSLRKEHKGLPKQVRARIRRTAVKRSEFETVLVQFMALGIIAKSERQRSVRDTGTYWTLTPYGQRQLISLRAIRRGDRY